MRISFSAISNIPKTSFASRNEKIRRADDLSRKSKEMFPMISETKYVTLASPHKKIDRYHRAISRLSRDIMEQRNKASAESEHLWNYERYPSVISNIRPVLNAIKETRKGNCSEMATAMFSILCANGYLNSRKARLYCKAEFTDKRTGKTALKPIRKIDHGFVITSMEKEDNFDFDKCSMIVDPWADIVDDKRVALKKYETIFKDDIEKIKKSGLEEIKNNNLVLGLIGSEDEFDPDNYEFRPKLYTEPSDFYTDEQIKNFQRYINNYLDTNFPKTTASSAPVHDGTLFGIS